MRADLSSTALFAIKNMLSSKEESTLSMKCNINDSLYEYTVSIKEMDQIIFEELIIDNQRFTREDFDDLGANYSFVRFIGRENINKDITSFYKYILNITYVGADKKIASKNLETKNFYDLLEEFNTNCEVIHDLFPEIKPLTFRKERNELGHEYLIADYNYKDKTYPFFYNKMISSGTRDFYEMLALINSIEDGGLLVIDEIEKTFHPDILIKLVRYVTTKYNIQIISTSHNTNFMKYLRPDQLYFVKNNDDSPVVNRLSELYPGIREIHNIEKLYMGGKFE